MDWAGWALFGFIGTVVLTGIMVFAQLAGWTRLDIPTMLGTFVTRDLDLARAIGVVVHLVIGQGFALLYTAAFALLGRSGALLGGAFGLVHGVAALTLLIPFLPGIHPRMSSERTGPILESHLEPPGLLALNFGARTPVVALIAHVAYGVTLGSLVAPT